MPKISVWTCETHGEIELVDFVDPKAFCPRCGKEMKKTGDYSE